ncbi:hypothetical protein [Actinomadura rugatobispora]|uniref:Uncharacterized protein n=1 Tax=Actinomadura rugatobispora TaxID=1994 RepID=A0ABW0ZYE9_9ACTN|nr:hypothetical protein GCM10010200_007350 [Actinomadura rugatobispora]
MPKKKRQPPQPGTDRYLCPADASNILGVKRHVIAEALRQAGREKPLTHTEARSWRDHPETAPGEGIAVLAAAASAKAEQEHRERQRDIEYEHRMLNLTEKVTKLLLKRAKHFRNPDAELIAQDMALRASKEMCRAHSDTCGDLGDPVLLSDLDIAALRWAGINPYDHSTWIVHRGDCPA